MRSPAGAAPAAAEPVEGPALLAGMSHGRGEMLVLGVLEVNSDGEERRYDGLRLWDLTRRLWPLEAHPEPLCRTLRFLGDFTKRDFLLRSSRYGYLVRADFVRAIVEPKRILFVGTGNRTFEAFRTELVKMIRAGVPEPEERSFDLWCVECLVCANVTMHTLRLQVMRPVIASILDRMDLHASESSILRLYPLKIAMSKFTEQVRPLLMGLRGLLHHEQDNVNSMMQSRLRRPDDEDPPAWRPGRFAHDLDEDLALPSPPPQPHVRHLAHSCSGNLTELSTPGVLPGGLEEILETWAHCAQEVMADAQELIASIEDATRFMEASMSYLRTRLLRLELVAMVVTLALAFGALISGVFGMNLKTGIEDEGGWFPCVVGVITASGALIVFVSWALFERGKRHYRLHCAQFGNNLFFQRLPDDEYVLSLGTPLPDGSLSKSALEKVLRDLRTPSPPLVQPPTSAPRPSTFSQPGVGLSAPAADRAVLTHSTSAASNGSRPAAVPLLGRFS